MGGWVGGTQLHHHLHPALHSSVLLLPALHSAYLFLLLGLAWLLWILSAGNEPIFVRKTDSEHRFFQIGVQWLIFVQYVQYTYFFDVKVHKIISVNPSEKKLRTELSPK